MRLQVKILILMVTTSILLSQLGLNIFINYCCCAKSEVFSFIPKDDHCKKLSKKHACCTEADLTKNVSIRKAPCSNKVLGYKSLESIAEKPAYKQLQVQALQIPFIPLFSATPAILLQESITPSFIYYPYESGYSLRILYCSWTC